eukprot:m.652143 g.652143  ORF g.652143 m.652143 type:complete len:265 (+) comp22688_c0_seq4:205-999(+)
MPVPQWQQLSRGNCNILVLTSIALRRNVTTPNLARRIVYFGRKEAVSRVSHSKRCYTACTIQDTASATVENDQHYDVCIIGGGVMGSSIAYWLRKLDNQVSVCVIERDATYTIASSALSVGSIRMQFSLAQNIRLSKFGVNFIKELANDPATNVAFDEGGYAFLASPGDGHDILKKNVALQRSLGAKIDTFEGESAIKAQFPWVIHLLGFGNSAMSPSGTHLQWYATHGYMYKERTLLAISLRALLTLLSLFGLTSEILGYRIR